MKSRLLSALSALVAISSFSGGAQAQTAQDASEDIRKYVPLLPSVKAQMWKIDPALGYAVKSIGRGMYVVSDNSWQSAFLVTNDGVIVFDAPASFGKFIPAAIAKVTDQPIKYLVYSHIHKDHIGGAGAFRGIKGLKIVATDTVGDFLSEVNDPDRPVPDLTFQTQKTITLGDQTVELTRHGYHSNEGDLFIYVPRAKFMMAVDCVIPGYAPFFGFSLTTNFHDYMRMFDQLLTYDFDTFVGGHLTAIGSKRDVLITKEFTLDVYNTVKRIHNGMDETAIATRAAKVVGTDNEFLLFKVVLDKAASDAVKELQARWVGRLAGVDVFLPSHVTVAEIYARWSDKK